MFPKIQARSTNRRSPGALRQAKRGSLGVCYSRSLSLDRSFQLIWAAPPAQASSPSNLCASTPENPHGSSTSTGYASITTVTRSTRLCSPWSLLSKTVAFFFLFKKTPPSCHVSQTRATFFSRSPTPKSDVQRRYRSHHLLSDFDVPPQSWPNTGFLLVRRF